VAWASVQSGWHGSLEGVPSLRLLLFAACLGCGLAGGRLSRRPFPGGGTHSPGSAQRVLGRGQRRCECSSGGVSTLRQRVSGRRSERGSGVEPVRAGELAGHCWRVILDGRCVVTDVGFGLQAVITAGCGNLGGRLGRLPIASGGAHSFGSAQCILGSGERWCECSFGAFSMLQHCVPSHG
jgi:hypothetical protein